MIAILDYGIGNVSSIQNMLKKIGAQSVITSSKEAIAQADKIILPGIGHFDYCMHQLRNAEFFEVLETKVMQEKTPLLGVCVGCQMLMDSSEEGSQNGLGWIKGQVIKFKRDLLPSDCKIPHMSWTEIDPNPSCILYNGITEPRFYFVHSYHISASDPANVTATAVYGYEFAASVQSGNILGVQFHPEKSHKFGMALYRNFANHSF